MAISACFRETNWDRRQGRHRGLDAGRACERGRRFGQLTDADVSSCAQISRSWSRAGARV